jgi:hypothetical protein
VRIVLPIAATLLVAAAPLAYFDAGASDSATEAGRLGIAAVFLLLAALPLGLYARSAARGLALLLAAIALLLVARWFGGSTVIQGDSAWVAFWVASGTLWTALLRAAA